MNNNYVVSLDVGITSIGFAIIDFENNKIIDTGVRMFNKAETAASCRTLRGARRNITRENWRKKQMVDAFVDFGLLTKEEVSDKNYLNYTFEGGNIVRPKDDTVYHLRYRALNEKVSKRELLLALYNIAKTRGHFLLENIDFSNNDAINFKYFKEKFYSFVENFTVLNDNRTDFEEKVLKGIFEKQLIKQNDIKSRYKEVFITQDENSYTSLFEAIKLICGFKCYALKLFDEEIEFTDKTINVNDLKKMDQNEVPELLKLGVELYDLIQIYNLLRDNKYICEANVKKIDKFKELDRNKDNNPQEYLEYIKQVKEVMNSKKACSYKVVKNLDNSYPNGLYIKEVRDILRKQKEFYPEITDELIEVACTIVSARIPFYIGPLSKDGKNAWVDGVNCKFKYSYEYTQNKFNAIDVDKAIRNWKERMISRCTYLPSEFALPKGSFVYEIYSILNEMNLMYVEDCDGNTTALKKLDKLTIINNLFLKKDRVTFKDVRELLGFKKFGYSNPSIKNFNNRITLYKNIINIIPELKVENVEEIFDYNNKIAKIESIILDLSLYSEEGAKYKHFAKEFEEKVAKSLSKINTTGFYSLSKKFLMDECMNVSGDSLMTILLEDNEVGVVNEQMTIITNATDKDGNARDFSANKYVEMMKDTKKLSIDLLIQDGKPTIPMSRSVVRSLNECFKVYSDIIRFYGVPSRVIIETAKEVGAKKEKSVKREDKLKNLYDSIEKQFKGDKGKELRKISSLDDWKDIEHYYKKNKDKIELYVSQLGKDMIDGKPIDINFLEKYEIDHILPAGFGDDSMDNKMLISREHNAKKSNRVPIEYIESDVNNATVGSYVSFVLTLHEMGTISKGKMERFLLNSTEEASGFINRDLVDTRYTTKELIAILKAFNKVNNYDTDIVCIKGLFTHIVRKAFKVYKNRDFGDQHHAHDACLIAITDKCLREFFPGYQKTGNQKMYKEFVENIAKSKMENGKGNKVEINEVFYKAYFKAFGESYAAKDSLINQMKDIKPLYSEKVIKNPDGKLFKDTISKQSKLKENNPLFILGVNNSLRVFSKIQCVAVDFYRYKVKGKTKHVAIQIPKIIVDNKGRINKEKYKMLVRDYYACPEILDEKGNIKEFYFRFRAFPSDLIYDTYNNIPMSFVCGCMVHKSLEYNKVKIYSYNQIYDRARKIKEYCVKNFELSKDIDNEILKEVVIPHLKSLFLEKDNERFDDVISKIKYLNLKSLCETLSYNSLWNINPNLNDAFKGRYRPVANNELIKNDSNAEYIKVKSSSLGVRWKLGENGLLISGPSGNENAYKKVKKEQFSWLISKYSV